MTRAFVMLTAVSAICAVSACTQDIEAGRASFANLCASCHGFDGKGAVGGAFALGVHAGDLTQLARNNGGAFPRAAVLARIERYTMEEVSPSFRERLDGRLVLVPTATGVLTPAAAPRVDISAYLESIQTQ